MLINILIVPFIDKQTVIGAGFDFGVGYDCESSVYYICGVNVKIPDHVSNI